MSSQEPEDPIVNTDALTADGGLARGFAAPGSSLEPVPDSAGHASASTRYTGSQSDDAVLMQRFQEAGDYSAFELLFERHKRGLLSFVIRLSGDRTIAEDVSQHTWLKLIDGARQRTYAPRPGATFQTWLYTLARNRFVDEYVRRHEVSRMSTEGDDQARRTETPDERSSPESEVERGQMKVLVEAAVRELPFEQREVIALWAAGTDIETMVRITGAPRDTVLSRRKYAIARLRRILTARGASPEAP
jgi:RNA polymerase sigma-70 factor (ECF subfamily)